MQQAPIPAPSTLDTGTHQGQRTEFLLEQMQQQNAAMGAQMAAAGYAMRPGMQPPQGPGMMMPQGYPPGGGAPPRPMPGQQMMPRGPPPAPPRAGYPGAPVPGGR